MLPIVFVLGLIHQEFITGCDCCFKVTFFQWHYLQFWGRNRWQYGCSVIFLRVSKSILSPLLRVNYQLQQWALPRVDCHLASHTPFLPHMAVSLLAVPLWWGASFLDTLYLRTILDQYLGLNLVFTLALDPDQAPNSGFGMIPWSLCKGVSGIPALDESLLWCLAGLVSPKSVWNLVMEMSGTNLWWRSWLNPSSRGYHSLWPHRYFQD